MFIATDEEQSPVVERMRVMGTDLAEYELKSAGGWPMRFSASDAGDPPYCPHPQAYPIAASGEPCGRIMPRSECIAFRVNGVPTPGYKDLIAKKPGETAIRSYLVEGDQVSVTLRIPDTLRDAAKEEVALRGMPSGNTCDLGRRMTRGTRNDVRRRGKEGVGVQGGAGLVPVS